MPDDHVETLVELAAGVYVESDVLRVVDAIHDYDSNLRVKYLDPDRGGEFSDTPYKIVEVCPDGVERVVFGVWQLDGRVLDRLVAADTWRTDVLGGIDSNNASAKAARARRFREEEVEPAHDLATHILASPRTTYTIPGPDGTRIKFDSHAPTQVRTRTGLIVKPGEAKGG